MPNVFNWQLNRLMRYWYRESRPKKQFTAVFDINKCIACQSCTIACKTTWTSGPGEEYMFWNNVETKPYGFYPLGWDVQLLEKMGEQRWQGEKYAGQTIFEKVPAGERVLGFLPADEDYAHPNLGEDEVSGVIKGGAHYTIPHPVWMFYLARICNHCTYPACLAACPRGAIYKRKEDGIVLVDQKRCQGYRECVRACPYKRVFYNAIGATSQKCIACYPVIEQGNQPQCFQNCIGKIRLQGFMEGPKKINSDNPIDYLVHVRKVALPFYPQFGLEPNVYYIPPIHVPLSFLEQMFGPGAQAAVEAYRNAQDDPKLVGLISLFGAAPNTLHRFKLAGEQVVGLDDKGREVTRVPVSEPVYVRSAYDKLREAARQNIS